MVGAVQKYLHHSRPASLSIIGVRQAERSPLLPQAERLAVRTHHFAFLRAVNLYVSATVEQRTQRFAALAAAGSGSGEILTAPVHVLTLRYHAAYPVFESRIVSRRDSNG